MSSLLTMDDLKPQRGAGTTEVHRTEGLNSYRLGQSGQRAREVIGELVPGEIIHYKTKGKWSTHQLLDYLLSTTGPGRVWLTTYTASEDPVRSLVRHLQAGTITELRCIFDYRIKTYNPQAFQLLSYNVSAIALVKNHSKVVVIENDTWAITAITSSNLNNNSRIEVGTIFTDRATAAFHRTWIDQEIENANGAD